MLPLVSREREELGLEGEESVAAKSGPQASSLCELGEEALGLEGAELGVESKDAVHESSNKRGITYENKDEERRSRGDGISLSFSPPLDVDVSLVDAMLSQLEGRGPTCFTAFARDTPAGRSR